MARAKLTMEKAFIILTTLKTAQTTYKVRKALGDEPRRRVVDYLNQLKRLGHIDSPDISPHITSEKLPNQYRITKLGEAFVNSYSEAQKLLYQPNPIKLWPE